MKERIFRFKQFAVHHEISAMKVGVDGVLLGAWANVQGRSLLDVGTGCGLLALMAAQRNASVHTLGIDVHAPSVEEAKRNAAESPWCNRIAFTCRCFLEQLNVEERFDVIISNPPFFHAGVSKISDDRQRSRHAADLSPQTLVCHATELLVPDGRLCMITPRDQLDGLLQLAASHSLAPTRLVEVATVVGKEPKRLLSEWILSEKPATVPVRILAIEEGEPAFRHFTDEYKTLCSPFYLHM